MSDDRRPKWMPVYEHLRTLGYNDAATYEHLSEIAGVEDIRGHRGFVLRACRELEREDRKTLICIENYGYRVADPTEHEHLGRSHRGRAIRQLQREYGRRAATPFELLPAEAAERQRGELLRARRAAEILAKTMDRPALPPGATV